MRDLKQALASGASPDEVWQAVAAQQKAVVAGAAAAAAAHAGGRRLERFLPHLLLSWPETEKEREGEGVKGRTFVRRDGEMLDRWMHEAPICPAWFSLAMSH